MPGKSFTIRTMTRKELDLAIGWAAAEGWNPGLNDAASFYAADPDGFLIGLLDDEPIACISVVKYGSNYAFLGLYIVQPAWRGLGYGLQIWQAGMATLAGRTIGLDGVQAQQENYAKFGFVLAYGNIRHQGSGSGGSGAAKPATLAAGVVPLASLPFELVCAYDQQLFPAPRSEFLRPWLAPAPGAALGVVQDGCLQAYGVVRASHVGYKIGPLMADTAELAETLFLALQAQVPEGVPLFLDTPACNPQALELARRHAMFPMFETARMYMGPCPVLPLARLFGVTSFELW